MTVWDCTTPCQREHQWEMSYAIPVNFAVPAWQVAELVGSPDAIAEACSTFVLTNANRNFDERSGHGVFAQRTCE